MQTVTSPVAPKIKLVVAGLFYQFIDWCFENELHPKSPRAKYVSRPEQLQGFDARGAELVKYGTWYLKKDLVPYVEEFEYMKTLTDSQK